MSGLYCSREPLVSIEKRTPPRTKTPLGFPEWSRKHKAHPLPSIEIKLIDEDGTIYTANVSPKSYRQAETDAAEFENWMALVGGKLSITEEGYNILEPTIRIFEEKVKVTSQ